MNLLASDLVSSDSDDADYVPPPQPNRSEPRMRKRAPGIQPPSDDDDDDDDDDQLSDDAFLADRQAIAVSSSAGASSSAAASAHGAASSSAAAASSSAAGSSSAHPAPAATLAPGAGSSANHASAAGSSANHASAAGSSANHASAAGSSANHASASGSSAIHASAAGSSAKHASGAVAPAGPPPSSGSVNPSGLPASDDQKLSGQSARSTGVVPNSTREPQSKPQPNTTKAPVLVAPSSAKEKLSQPSQQTVVEKAAPVVEKAAPVEENDAGNTVPSSKLESNSDQPPLKRARIAPQKKSIDDIWAEMNNNPPPKPEEKANKDSQAMDSWLQKPAEKPSKPFKVRMLGDLEKEQTEQSKTKTPEESQTPETGLEAVLGLVRGKKSSTVLDGTRKQWTQFKKKDEEVNEELESYKKGKERYTDRMAFLARSDVREWEFEQRGKRKRR